MSHRGRIWGEGPQGTQEEGPRNTGRGTPPPGRTERAGDLLPSPDEDTAAPREDPTLKPSGDSYCEAVGQTRIRATSVGLHNLQNIRIQVSDEERAPTGGQDVTRARADSGFARVPRPGSRELNVVRQSGLPGAYRSGPQIVILSEWA